MVLRLDSLPDWIRRRPVDVVAALLALAVGVVVFAVATDLFAYHSVNDDEGVYLLQASMLLEGQLFLYPDARLVDLVRPWFFVVDTTPAGPRLYPKYAPVPAAVFAVGMALGEPRLSLGVVAAGIALGTYLLGRTVFDRVTGVVAVVLLASAPMFLLSGSVFLPYAPTTLFNLAFAIAYLRSVREGSGLAALVAGVAIGVAFFARPYTAVVFAAPFVVHACWRLWTAAGDRTRFGSVLRETLLVAVPGTAFVLVTLGYNALVTGSATTFPYEAFAPRDGLGFGRREILGFTETYTPELAFESTVTALDLFATRFGPLGTLGTALALVGLVALGSGRPEVDVDRGGVALLCGVAASVVLGNAYFWGTFNGLRNGLIDLLGPYYHFDLLVPTALFAALGTVTLWRRTRTLLESQLSTSRARLVLVLLVLVSAPVSVSAERDVLGDPWAENRLRTDTLVTTYEPLDREFEDALVYTPDPYGDWQQHPFQYLRNDPGFDGSRLYVLDGGPDADVRALDATDRTPYRFTYRGAWTGGVTPVTPEVTRLRVLRADAVTARTTVGAPAGAQAASVRIETEEGFARYRVDDVGGSVTVDWSLATDGVRVTNHPRAAGPVRVALPSDETEVDLVVRFATPGGASVFYRQEVTLDASGRTLRVIWPPETRICRLRPECGTEGTWVGPDGSYLDGVSVETEARVTAAA